MKQIFITLIALGLCVSLNASQWLTSYEAALKKAQQENKLILIDFWAPWCGPCKKMDQEVWKDKEVKELQKHFVAVKVDIDQDVETAGKYNVKAIPTVMITDSWGNVLVKNNYLAKGPALRLLAAFPNNIEKINAALKTYLEDEKNHLSNLAVGEAYQLYVPYLKDTAKKTFLKQSDSYLNKSIKLSKKSKDDASMSKGEILKNLNLVYRGKSKKAVSQLEEMVQKQKVNPIYKPLAYYVMVLGCREMEDKDRELEFITTLGEMKGGKTYMKKLVTTSDKT